MWAQETAIERNKYFREKVRIVGIYADEYSNILMSTSVLCKSHFISLTLSFFVSTWNLSPQAFFHNEWITECFQTACKTLSSTSLNDKKGPIFCNTKNYFQKLDGAEMLVPLNKALPRLCFANVQVWCISLFFSTDLSLSKASTTCRLLCSLIQGSNLLPTLLFTWTCICIKIWNYSGYVFTVLWKVQGVIETFWGLNIRDQEYENFGAKSRGMVLFRNRFYSNLNC